MKVTVNFPEQAKFSLGQSDKIHPYGFMCCPSDIDVLRASLNVDPFILSPKVINVGQLAGFLKELSFGADGLSLPLIALATLVVFAAFRLLRTRPHGLALAVR